MHHPEYRLKGERRPYQRVKPGATKHHLGKKKNTIPEGCVGVAGDVGFHHGRLGVLHHAEHRLKGERRPYHNSARRLRVGHAAVGERGGGARAYLISICLSISPSLSLTSSFEPRSVCIHCR